jgi:hypothetical protein
MGEAWQRERQLVVTVTLGFGMKLVVYYTMKRVSKVYRPRLYQPVAQETSKDKTVVGLVEFLQADNTGKRL